MSDRNIADGKGILQLAYLGDAVTELFVREYLLQKSDSPSGRLNKIAKGFVSLEAQSDAAERILDILSEKELSVFKRGRNTATAHTPSHGELIQYRRATGFEALLGYLYLSGNEERARELFYKAYDGVFEKLCEEIK